MFITKFIYELTGQREPTDEDLDDEVDRLLCLKGAEEPSYLVKPGEQDLFSGLDCEVLAIWIRRKFEPAIILLLLTYKDNFSLAQSELVKMDKYQTPIEKLFRCNFVKKRALERVVEVSFQHRDEIELQKKVLQLKKTLTFLSKHLETSHPTSLTLQGTDAYTAADVALYNYLKRLVIGKYKDLGLKSHVKLCEPLVKFMNRFAAKNPHVINVIDNDVLTNSEPESSLFSDIMKPTVVAMGFVLFFLWRRG